LYQLNVELTDDDKYKLDKIAERYAHKADAIRDLIRQAYARLPKEEAPTNA